jgi:hypothetical protein
MTCVVPDPLPLRNIPVPPEVTAVTGCDCGGLEWHRLDSAGGPGCSIWELPPGEAAANTAAAPERHREHTDALNASLRAALP